MAFQKVAFSLSEAELDALEALALADCRTMRDVIRFLVRTEARRRGLWQEDPAPAGERSAETTEGETWGQ